jgi:hypothetical protein
VRITVTVTSKVALNTYVTVEPGNINGHGGTQHHGLGQQGSGPEELVEFGPGG